MKTTKQTAVTKHPVDETTRTLEQKWSKPLIAAGYTVIPTIILQRQQVLGLTTTDMNILLQLAAYWWSPEKLPFPSKRAIAAAIGISSSQVRKRIAAMEAAGFLERHERRAQGRASQTNVYSFKGLIREATPHAEAELRAIELRKAEKQKRLSAKGKGALALVKGGS